MSSNRDLFAVLNWGLGHATRSIPLINKLESRGREVIVASDGLALDLLRQELKGHELVVLPGYDVRYNFGNLTVSMLLQFPAFQRSIWNDRRAMKRLVHYYQPERILSDNRYGAWSKSTYNILISHQLRIVTSDPLKSRVANLALSNWRRPFQEIWVPDHSDRGNLSGALSSIHDSRVTHIGPQSRLSPCTRGVKSIYTGAAILSGPEPLRSRFEKRLLNQLNQIEGRWAVIRGTDRSMEVQAASHVDVLNMAGTSKVNKILCSTNFAISRSGYSSIMDYDVLKLPALLVPTPGQPEQEYLAGRLRSKEGFIIQKQNKLDIKSAMQLLKIPSSR